MSRSLHTLALLSIVALSSMAGLAGCKVDCHETDAGGTECTAKTVPQIIGEARNGSANYTAGQSIRVSIDGANTRRGSMTTAILVKSGGDAGVVSAQFTPFISAETTDEANTKFKSLTTDIRADSANNEIVVVVDANGKDSSMSARVDLVIPAEFEGNIVVSTSDGDIEINGANGFVDVTTGLGDILVGGEIHGVNAQTDNGDVEVDLSNEIASDEGGSIYTGLGDITLKIPASSSFSLQAVTDGDGQVSAPNPLPSGWVASEENTTTAQSFRANAGGETWKVTADGVSSVIEIDAY